jgi:predicted ATPase
LQPGSVCNADTVQSLDLPWSIRSVVGRRVSRLPSAGQDVLRLASVLGQEFDLPVLVAMADMDESVVLDQVEAALATRLLEERGGRQVERYAFVHALIAQALYEDMPRFRLRRLHGRAAEAIHRVHGQRPEVAAELARHLLAGGDDQRAAHFHELAGDHAATMFARVEAIGHFRAAVELLVSREENVAAATVQCKLGGWLGTLAQPDEAEAMLEAALATLETAGDAADQAVAHRVLAQIQHWCRHDWNGARAHVDAALRLWPAAGQDRELVSILLRAARGAGNDGDHETASSYIGRARDVAEQLGESAPRLWVLSETSAFCSLRKACRQA